MESRSILILGKPDSGKTTFVIQLYSRLIKNKSSLKLYASVGDLSPIMEARERLANGLEVEPTASQKYTELLLPIAVGDKHVDVRYPDSGGEQVKQIVEERAASKVWLQNLRGSDDWILFVRPSQVASIKDLTNTTLDKENAERRTAMDSLEFEMSDQSFLIELLQILLHLRGQDSHFLVDSVRLTIVMTCWDEVDTGESPEDKFRGQLPLMAEFVFSNWGEDRVKVFGLSAQGFSLDTEAARDKYRDNGPENFGFLVLPDGKKSDDLTLLISEIA